MTRVLFHYEPGPALSARLGGLEAEGLRVDIVPVPDREALAACLPQAEVFWHVLDPITADTIRSAPRLRLIQKIGVGVNTIDLEAARRRGNGQDPY